MGTPVYSLQLISVRWWNGSAHHAVMLAQALNQRGWPAWVAGREGSPAVQQSRQRRLPVYDGLDHESLTPWKLLRNLHRLGRFIRTHSIQVIHAHRAEDQFHALLLRQKLRVKVPVIRTVSDLRPPRANPLNRFLYTRGLAFCLFTCRSVQRHYLQLWPELAARTAVVPGAVDTRYFQPWPRNQALRESIGVRPNQVLIGLLARLSPVKGHHQFLQAARLLASRYDQVRFLISGQAVEIHHTQLQQDIQRLGLADRVILLDRQNDVRPLLAALDIGVVASLDSEVTCRIAMEMLAMGLPVVGTRVNALLDVIQEGTCGFLASPGQPTAMADALSRCIENPERRRAMSRKARRHAEQYFSPETFARQVQNIYRQVLNEKET